MVSQRCSPNAFRTLWSRQCLILSLRVALFNEPARSMTDSETSFEPMKPELAESARPRRHVGCAYSLVFMTDALWQGLPCLIESAETVSPPTDDGRFALNDMYAVVTQRAFTKVA